MQEDTDERLKIIDLIKTEEQKEKEKKNKKKQELRKIMDQDWQDKRMYKESKSVDKHNLNTDIDENNILSYLYTNKDHQAYVYDKKKQHLIDLIVKNNSQLGSPEALH